ncbi:MAG: hypothetical protein Q8K99_11755 [Actinomycetota bacterium]|nr:hypothetical protein [Actinomycetota bacterium]
MRRRRFHLFAGLALLVIAAGGVLLFGQRGASGQSVSSVGGESLAVSGTGSVPYYLQNDPAWAAETLGGSGETMGSAGCTVSCIASGVSALGSPMDPGEVCAALKSADGFTGSGEVIWSAVSEITGGKIRIELPVLSYDVIDRELSQGRPVITKVMLSETVPHWVLIVAKDGQEYLVVDPLNQERRLVRLSERSATIHAIRVLRRG